MSGDIFHFSGGQSTQRKDHMFFEFVNILIIIEN